MNTRNDTFKTLGDDVAAVGLAVSQSTENAVREGAHQLKEKSVHLRDATTTYIQHEPVKSVLIAAAVGATLMGLVALFSRSGGSAR